MNKFLVGVLIIVAGFAGYYSSAFVAPGEFFQDEYPVENEWGASGSHDNTLSDENGNLVIDNTTEGEGVFTSDIIEQNGKLEVERIVFEADQISANQGEYIDLKVRTRENGVVTETLETSIESGGVQSISTGNLSSRQFDSYQFIATLYTDSSDSPRLNSLTIQGQSFPDDDPLSYAFMAFMFFLGFWIIIKEVIYG